MKNIGLKVLSYVGTGLIGIASLALGGNEGYCQEKSISLENFPKYGHTLDSLKNMAGTKINESIKQFNTCKLDSCISNYINQINGSTKTLAKYIEVYNEIPNESVSTYEHYDSKDHWGIKATASITPTLSIKEAKEWMEGNEKTIGLANNFLNSKSQNALDSWKEGIENSLKLINSFNKVKGL